MMGLKIIVLALTLVDAAKYECLNIDDVDRAAKQQFCDDISAAISEDNQQVERLKFYGRAGPGWTAKTYPFSFINPRRMWPDQEWEQESRSGGTMDFDNGNLGTFLSRRIEDCVWWKGALVHKDLFPVEDVMTYDAETKTRTFEPIPSWVKNYFSQWSAGDIKISGTSQIPRMIKHWDANITGLMRDDDPEAFWSHWINGRMPMFSKAHDKIVYDILKEPACNFKTYKTVAEWASQGPDLDGANVCNFRQRDWRTVCRDPTFNSYCPIYAISYSGFKTFSADHAKMKVREPSSASSLTSDMYGARYNQIFGQAFGRGMVLDAPRLNRFTSGYYTPEEFFQKFIDEQQYVTGSVKTWPAQREAGDHWQMSFERSKLDHWAGMVEGEPWTGENMGFVDALRKHKKTLIGKSNDIFHQDECGSGATTIIMSTLTLLIMLF